jgi:polyhydroxyalkanoate synthesis regulator protein
VFPVPLLHRLLRSNEQLVNDFVQRYFNQALTAFLDSQRSVEQYLRQAMGLQSPNPAVSDWAKMMWGPFNPSLWPGQAPRASANEVAGSPAPRPTPPAPDDQELRPVVDELRQQIAELKEQLGRSKKPPTKRGS